MYEQAYKLIVQKQYNFHSLNAVIVMNVGRLIITEWNGFARFNIVFMTICVLGLMLG